MATVTELLNSLDSKHAAWVEQILLARWVADGDKGSQLFFKSFKSMASSKHIPAMLNAEGESLTAWDEMATQAVNFFQDVLGHGTPEAAASPSLAQRTEVLDVA